MKAPDVLTIRTDQMQVFRTGRLRAFEGEMTAHLADFSPPLSSAIGLEQLRRAVELGIARAASHGFTHRGPVRLYLELMLLFGSYFDTDPQYHWASRLLADSEHHSQKDRAELLYDRTLDYQHEVAGPDNAHAVAALRGIRSMAALPPPLDSGDFPADIIREIAQVYPHKAAYVGAGALEALVGKGVETAHDFGLSTRHQAALMIVLMVAFGHGCADDPLYPWIGATLRDHRIVDSAARTRRLTSKALTWLDHVLAHFEAAPRP